MPAVRWSLAGSKGGVWVRMTFGPVAPSVKRSHLRGVTGTEVRAALPRRVVSVGMDDGRAAALAHIGSLPEPRRSQLQHLHDVIISAIPEADVTMWEYGGTLIGRGGA